MRETLQLIFSIRNHVKARVGSSFLSNFRLRAACTIVTANCSEHGHHNPGVGGSNPSPATT